MEALQASALPLGYATKNWTIPLLWKKNNPPFTLQFMKPIPFNVLALLFNQRHTSQRLVEGASIDSRTLLPGDLFFALPGERVDGHHFLQEAAFKGAAGAIVSSSYTGPSHGLALLYVPDVLQALQELARIFLAKSRAKVIAITGSLGKTTTKEFASQLLARSYRLFASPRSYNSQVTLPLTILMADGTEDYLILEMGMTHEGNINNLISIAPPNIAMITTVAVQHACNFSDGLEGIGREKAAIFSHPKTTLGFLHHDMPHAHLARERGSCSKKTFSTRNCDADYYLDEYEQGVRIHAKGELPFEVPLQLPMRAHYHNFLAAAALAHTLEVPWNVICEASGSLKLPPMRFERIEKGGILFINDAYNANPDAMQAALESCPKPQSGGKVIAVLGEMDALGSYCEEGHAKVGQTALEKVDRLLCLGQRCAPMVFIWQKEGKPVELFDSFSAMLACLQTLARPGDVVLLKGARKHSLEKVLEAF